MSWYGRHREEVLDASQVTGVAACLKAADFDDLWRQAREKLLLRLYHEPDDGPAGRVGAEYGDAVVKWLVI